VSGATSYDVSRNGTLTPNGGSVSSGQPEPGHLVEVAVGAAGIAAR
jgi:hypothetical protein